MAKDSRWNAVPSDSSSNHKKPCYRLSHAQILPRRGKIVVDGVVFTVIKLGSLATIKSLSLSLSKYEAVHLYEACGEPTEFKKK